MFEKNPQPQQPQQQQQQKKKKRQTPKKFLKKHKHKKTGSNSGDPNGIYSVTATTSKNRTPLPPNQEKKVNNKKAARKRREQLLQAHRKDNETPLSTGSDSSTTRLMLDEMNLIESDDVDLVVDMNTSDSEDLIGTDEYKELPTDALILNTETVEKIIEQIATDIESEAEDMENASSSDSDEFGAGEALNAGVQRYFIENSGPKCFNCGETGHVLKDCPATSTVPCNLCGLVGHSRFNCPQEVCYNCSRPGHQSKACPAKRKRRVYDDDLCNRCGQPGHLARECSMSWRGYVFARDLPRSHSAFLEELRGLRKRCYNCASISHFGDDCPNRRRPNYSVFHIPDYDYLDRVICKIKRSTSTMITTTTNQKSVKMEQNAKQKQADNFKKIVHNNKETSKNHAHQKHHQSSKQNRSKSAKNDDDDIYVEEDDFTIYDDDDEEYDDKSHLSNAKKVNRQVFLQSRGIQNDFEDSQIKKPGNVPFVRYEDNQVRVKDYNNNYNNNNDYDEDNFRKGSSGNKKNFGKPTYRGGYK